jgi:uncharacterized protein YcfJ
MKRLALVSVMTTAAVAAHAQNYVDNARVIGVEPQYESVNVPRQECSNRWVAGPRRVDGRDVGGAIIGGAAGALLGNQFGHGHGRQAATAIGAVFGALAGNNIANRDRRDGYEQAPREVTECRVVTDVQTRVVGYQVTYEYRGQHFTTLMQESPGTYVPVRVSVDPVGR